MDSYRLSFLMDLTKRPPQELIKKPFLKKRFGHRSFFVSLLLPLLGAGCGSGCGTSRVAAKIASPEGDRAPAAAQAQEAVPSGSFEPVYRKLLAQGADREFIEALAKDPAIQVEPEIVRKNVLNFAIPARYENFLNRQSLKSCRTFLKRNRSSLQGCEKRFGVPKEVIASLLWVETKHGAHTGKNYVPGVFMNLALADQPEMVAHSMAFLKEKVAETNPKFAELKQKVEERSPKKAAWAVQELLALGRMRKELKIDLTQLRGSVSGAFGMPQFIPSSFLQWAVDGDGDGAVELFSAKDAICSVAHYLSKNGWGPEPTSKEQALYHYNRSTDYGQTILNLARMVRGRKASGRALASTEANTEY